MSDKWDNKRVGSLWCRKSKTGKPYMSGSVNIDGKVTKVICFEERVKQSDTSADWIIYESKDDYKKDKPAPAKSKPAPKTKPEPAKNDQTEQEKEDLL